MDTGGFSKELLRPEHEADYLPVFSAEIKNAWILCGLLCDALSIAPNGRMTDELKRIWKEVLVAYFRYCQCIRPQGLWKSALKSPAG
jgi:hypothetical protein